MYANQSKDFPPWHVLCDVDTCWRLATKVTACIGLLESLPQRMYLAGYLLSNIS